MITRARLGLALVLFLAGAMTLFKVPVASSQGLTLRSEFVTDDLSEAGPDSELWDRAAPIEVPLSAQAIAKPLLSESPIRSIEARALNNESQIAVLVEWADETLDDSMVRVQDFRDSVALQFPITEGQPFFCMGQAGGDVNIWHWKADWQADLLAREDVDSIYPNMAVNYYPFAPGALGVTAGIDDYDDADFLTALAAGNPLAIGPLQSPVEDLIAGGFGTLTTQDSDQQNVGGLGVWEDNKWRVVFFRELDSPEEHDVAFAADQVFPMALAVWDGSNNERDGQKSTSQWVSLQLADSQAADSDAVSPTGLPEPSAIEPMVAILFLAGLVAGALIIVFTLRGRRG